MRKINKPKLRFKEFKNEWQNKKIIDVAEYGNGNAFERKLNKNGKFNVVSLGSVSSEGKLKENNKRTDENSKLLKKSDLVMILSFHSHGIIGMNAIIPCDNKYVLNQRMGMIRVSNQNNPYFMHYMLNLIRKKFELVASGLSQLNLSKNDILNMNINIPTVKEQIQIGLFFNKIDDLIELKSNKIERLERLKRGYLQKIFPDPTENKPKLRFNGFNDDWKTEKIKNIANFFSGGTPKVGNKEYYKKEIPFIRSSEINSNTTDLFISKKGLDNSSAKLVDKGTILYAMYGATSGKVAISKINGAINQAVLAIKTNNNIDKQFLVLFLEYVKNKIISKYIQGGQGNLSASIIKNISFKIPTLAEQTRVGKTMALIDKQINLQQKELDNLKTLKKGYLQKMFV